MAEPQITARSRAQGVMHVRHRHTDRFTVVGNHLTQHRELTLTAIGLAAHIQSLPEGARVDIKTLAERFPEGETRIAAALHELEAHGYLSRTRERLPSGRIVTRTSSYDRPVAAHQAPTGPVPAPVPMPVRAPAPVRVPVPRPAARPVRPRPEVTYDLPRPVRAAPPGPAEPVPRPRPVPHGPEATYDHPRVRPVPRPRPVQPVQLPAPPVPPTAGPPDQAAALLADLGRYDPRLLLSAREVRRLAPAVSAWLERGVSPDHLRRALTTDLPDVPHHPAGLLAYRLAALREPPPVRSEPPPALSEPPPNALRPPPLQNCDGCDRAFRSPEPGRCRSCRTTGAATAA